MYEQVRRPRTTKVMDLSIENSQGFHMLDRGERKGKDGQYQRTKSLESPLNRFADPGFQDWLFGCDVVKKGEEVQESYQARRNPSPMEIRPQETT